jgi:hypothetical protein
MKKTVTKKLREEILLTLKNGKFEVNNDSKLCEIFEVSIQFFDVFKRPKVIEIDRECKIELLKWLEKGYIETDNSVFAKAITPPTFFDIMVRASQVEED